MVSPSTITGAIAIPDKSFGEVTTIHYEHPELRKLMNGTITELTLQVRDEYNNLLHNNNLPISILLEFIK